LFAQPISLACVDDVLNKKTCVYTVLCFW